MVQIGNIEDHEKKMSFEMNLKINGIIKNNKVSGKIVVYVLCLIFNIVIQILILYNMFKNN